MLHSLGLDRCEFDGLRATLSDQWRVVSFDQRGHGSATEQSSNVLAEYVADAIAAIELSGGERVHLVGHSMGGVVAALAAAAVPHRVCSLCLVATPSAGNVAFAERGKAALAHGMQAAVQPTLDRWFGDNPSGADATAIEYCRHALTTMRPSGFSDAWRALATFEGFADIAERLPATTLCIAGADDLSTPPASMQRIVDAFSSSTRSAATPLAVIPHAGHMVLLTNPEAVAALLQSHWTAAHRLFHASELDTGDNF